MQFDKKENNDRREQVFVTFSLKKNRKKKKRKKERKDVEFSSTIWEYIFSAQYIKANKGATKNIQTRNDRLTFCYISQVPGYSVLTIR